MPCEHGVSAEKPERDDTIFGLTQAEAAALAAVWSVPTNGLPNHNEDAGELK